METQNYVTQTLHDYKAGLGHFMQKLPQVGNAYTQFTAACFQSGALAEKSKHLIALGIAVCAQDEYCIVYHTNAALETGATEQEILETVAVSGAFGGGMAMSQGVTIVQDVIAVFGQQAGH